MFVSFPANSLPSPTSPLDSPAVQATRGRTCGHSRGPLSTYVTSYIAARGPSGIAAMPIRVALHLTIPDFLDHYRSNRNTSDHRSAFRIAAASAAPSAPLPQTHNTYTPRLQLGSGHGGLSSPPTSFQALHQAHRQQVSFRVASTCLLAISLTLSHKRVSSVFLLSTS
ncbi:hypothetical protein RB213_001127 [Colletotrichum asianum]